MACDSVVNFFGFLLSAMGATILIVWPETGPSAWVRESILRKLLPGRASGVVDCYVCLSFWMGLAFGALWWCWTGKPMYWCGCLMIPAVFWIVLHMPTREDDEEIKSSAPSTNKK